jgi:hypothetical protein
LSRGFIVSKFIYLWAFEAYAIFTQQKIASPDLTERDGE